MNKSVIAMAALVLSTGGAVADVKISGFGRTGLFYYENGHRTGGGNSTQVSSRLRFIVNATTITDSGVKFGARFRWQWDQGDAAMSSGSPPSIYAAFDHVTVYVGNVPTAFDSANLLKASQMGIYDRSEGGDPLGDFFSFENKSYRGRVNRVGLAVEYEAGSLVARASFVNPDQTGNNEDGIGFEEELGASLDYAWDNGLSLSTAAVFNGSGYKDNDQYFVGAQFAVNDNARVGMNFINNGSITESDDLGQTLVLYGNLAWKSVSFDAYVANNDGDWSGKTTDQAYGIGVNYDLGGARLAASLQRDYSELLSIDTGVRFSF
ncbi:porin (plasmid) [Paracoccus methylovorus]|uniref:Porin n=1 Tax=Paracoccus methylovorus TaxID=2812658 RepID=A0ABX7JPF3_9RHOB|nr:MULTISPECIES: porin [Paracoccus]QRZ16157.1 porin [Paracoccus methylovorus]